MSATLFGVARLIIVDDATPTMRAVRSALAADGHAVERLAALSDLPASLRIARPDLLLYSPEKYALLGRAIEQFVRQSGLPRIPVCLYTAGASLTPEELTRVLSKQESLHGLCALVRDLLVDHG